MEHKTVDYNEKTQEFRDYYNKNRELFESALRVYVNFINALLVDTIQIESILSRVKTVDEAIGKFERKYLAKLDEHQTNYQMQDYITDLLGVRVVCLYLDDIKSIQRLIEENFKQIEVSDKIAQIENTDNKFGYKGLHFDLQLDDSRTCLPEYAKFKDFRFELQIRTIIQDAWSVLDHKIVYKRSIPQTLKRRINRLSALFEVADEEFIRIKQEIQSETERAKKRQEGVSRNQSGLHSDVLDVFLFIPLVQDFFPLYQFIEYKADGFVGELLYMKPNLTAAELYLVISNRIETIKRYASNRSQMNPYTMLRHILYEWNKDLFKDLLYESQRQAFDKWLDAQNEPNDDSDMNI